MTRCDIYLSNGQCPREAVRQVRAGAAVGRLFLCGEHAVEEEQRDRELRERMERESEKGC